MFFYLVTTIHILVCFFIIIVVLLQSGKSGDISAAFGGQGSQTAFGPRGAASALSRATTWSAVAFMITSITLSIYAQKRGGPSGPEIAAGKDAACYSLRSRPAQVKSFRLSICRRLLRKNRQPYFTANAAQFPMPNPAGARLYLPDMECYHRFRMLAFMLGGHQHVRS